MPRSGYIYTRLLADGCKERAKTLYGNFASLEEKLNHLIKSCKDGHIYGVPASELLRCGGDKNIMWIDIDTPNIDALKEWSISTHFPFPHNSFCATPSTTGNIHLFVSTDRQLSKDECFPMLEWLIEHAPEPIAIHIDRIYGPQNLEPIFLPLAAQEAATLPQILLQRARGVFKIPDIDGSIYSMWKKRNKSTE